MSTCNENYAKALSKMRIAYDEVTLLGENDYRACVSVTEQQGGCQFNAAS